MPARGLRPWAGTQFRDENPVSYCTGVTSYFSNYLTNRKQCTQVKGSVSKLNNLTYGVPQGSTCGPLLFFLYINDLWHFIQIDINAIFLSPGNSIKTSFWLIILAMECCIINSDCNYCKPDEGCMCNKYASHRFLCEFRDGNTRSTFPTFLKGQRITVLNLRWLASTLPDISNGKLSRMPNLTEISLYGAVAQQFRKNTFAGLRTLNSLEVKGSQIPEEPDWLKHLGRLRQLNLHYNVLNRFSLKHFCALDHLKYLKVNYNTFIKGQSGVIEMSSNSSCLPELTRLDLSHNEIRSINLSSKELPKLSILHAKLSNLTVFRINYNMVESLTELDLSSNQLSALVVHNIQKCKKSNLTEMYVNNNQLTNISEGLLFSICNKLWEPRVVCKIRAS